MKEYDYSQEGGYFLTICTAGHRHLLGEVTNCEAVLSKYGAIAQECWQQIPTHFTGIILDEFIVMPNHIHGVVIIRFADDNVGARHAVPLREFGRLPRQSLHIIVGSFKSAVTRQVNAIRKTPNTPFWQRNYYERVIRNEPELNRIKEYIVNNPVKWQFDRENPNRTADKQYEQEWKWLEYGKQTR